MGKNDGLRKIVFLTGTRADFGKLKPLMLKVEYDSSFENHIFVTGMHMLSKYGFTADEVKKSGFKNIYKFINQNASDRMDHVLAKTVLGLSDYVKEVSPHLIVVHGDRVEALAGAIVGSLNNILVAHIEGGEVSGTVDELIRHSVTKLAHVHFVSNSTAKKRLIQLGESDSSIHVIGSPDIDVMNSNDLPDLSSVKNYYDIDFNSYAILMFHPVTTEIDKLERHTKILVNEIIRSGLKFIVIYPNNDTGTEIIMRTYGLLDNNPNVKIFPSMRFEYFLTILKNADFIIGNSSAGVREAPHYGVPSINLGTRQLNRVQSKLVLDTLIDSDSIKMAMNSIRKIKRESLSIFGNGNSANKFEKIIKNNEFWKRSPQKHFVDFS